MGKFVFQVNLLYSLSIVFILTICNAAYVPYPYYSFHGNQPSLQYEHTPTFTSVTSNILRTPGNLGQISTYHKAIDTPYSSVRKSDVRISNDIVTPITTAIHVATPLHIPATPVHAVDTSPVAITYSAAPTIAHLTFDGFGTHYAW
ncbi:hypothetical protein PGB90_001044 [Kerria lacca]